MGRQESDEEAQEHKQDYFVPPLLDSLSAYIEESDAEDETMSDITPKDKEEHKESEGNHPEKAWLGSRCNNPKTKK